ncbi:MAG: hypothetical protein PHX68_05020 [Alphaproteobacteria bacterium]|nr:hypothetical protein [Alphaproteobacteria bacterium]
MTDTLSPTAFAPQRALQNNAAPPKPPTPPPPVFSAEAPPAHIGALKNELAGKLKELVLARQKLDQIKGILAGAQIATQDAEAGRVPGKYAFVASRYVQAKDKVAELVRLCRDIQDELRRQSPKNDRKKPQTEKEPASNEAASRPAPPSHLAQRRMLENCARAI